nr:MAG TPA: hypothetical protein [Inoviridae sp.]
MNKRGNCLRSFPKKNQKFLLTNRNFYAKIET